MTEYLTRKELAARLKHSEGYIMNWTYNAMVEGIHFIHLNGSSKFLYNWDAVETLMHYKR